MEAPVKRAYDGARRRAGSEATQRRIVEAATELFLRDGYGRTSVEAIAEAAGVSPATIYKLFGTKVAIAKRVGDVAVAGDHEAPSLAQRDWYLTARHATDPSRALRLIVEHGAALLARITPIIEMATAAAHIEPALAGFVGDGDQGRWRNNRRFIESLQSRGSLRPGLTVEDATDMMWTIQSPATVAALVMARGWSLDRYREWVLDQLEHAILAKGG